MNMNFNIKYFILLLVFNILIVVLNKILYIIILIMFYTHIYIDFH